LRDEGGAPSPKDLDRLRRYFDENVTFSRHVGARVEGVESGRAVVYLDVGEEHLNGGDTVHGGVHALLLDNAMGIAAISSAGRRVATAQMNIHFLGPVREGRVRCKGEVLHTTRRTVTTEGRAYDAEGNLVALATGAFRIFESRGDPAV